MRRCGRAIARGQLQLNQAAQCGLATWHREPRQVRQSLVQCHRFGVAARVREARGVLQEIGVAGRRAQRVLQKFMRLPRFSIQFKLTDPVLQACIQSPPGASRPQNSGNQR